MAKFTKLNIGAAVASSGGRAWKKLSVESATDDSIVGTWTYNGTAEDFPGVKGDVYIGSYSPLTSPCGTYTWSSGSRDIYSSNKLNESANVYFGYLLGRYQRKLYTIYRLHICKR